MTELATLARPYAEAAFKQAKQSSNADTWSASLSFLAQVAQSDNLIRIIDNPKVGKAKATELLLDIVQEHVHGEGKNLLKLLVANDKVKVLPEIAVIFEQLKANDEGYVNVNLTSAYALSKAEQNKYVGMLEKLLNRKINAKVSVDHALIGGVIAKAGDKVIDASVRGQLQQLAKRL
ncbi:MAG: F0F1 ATP synthase subunit delta [Methylomonas sp.]|nr:MAG: F0F1 ATP synthase subunit delta [Methylomonas sp.]PPD26994.1 MAG: F0F1 ATP synthase subunit delta [Methylomonas sp.]PPD38933.1 MAG: F0F1 ATP synthase subunit delta [Methylomonas sp.]PPD42583.1 MAG: F0F1 ATP synthase subunit delta [Methylomonas sp.]PPD54145.1 MAG: F0F1 ATP synthase subunit delta [Methylomonas sp.]